MAVKKVDMKTRKEAFLIWARSDGRGYLDRIAKEVGMTEMQIHHYKKKDKWDEKLKKYQAKQSKKLSNVSEVLREDSKFKDASEDEMNEIQEILDNSGLTDKRKIFILHYLNSLNITQAALNAGYPKASARVRGFEIINDERIKPVVGKIVNLMQKNLYVSARDVVDEYVKIAFADITDYVEFDKQQVNLKPSDQVDGRLITEVKQGRDGLTIKLADKMKALERLEKLFEIMPDRKLQLERDKFEWSKKMADQAGEGGNKNVTIINDIR